MARRSRRKDAKRPYPDEPTLGCHERNEKKKLLILDVNGLLADIVSDPEPGYTSYKRVAKKAVFKRKYCDEFLEFCFDNFNVGIWSSRNRRNLESVVDYIMGGQKNKLMFCWNQEHCTDSGQVIPWENDKPLFFKELKKLWDKEDPTLPWEKGDYDESNPLLIDDTPSKGLLNPIYTGIFPLPYTYLDDEDDYLVPGGWLHEYLQMLAKSDHVWKFVEENPFGMRPITDGTVFWPFYAKFVKEPNWPVM